MNYADGGIFLGVRGGIFLGGIFLGGRGVRISLDMYMIFFSGEVFSLK